MKAYIILINWVLSFFALGVETTDGGVWPAMVGLLWFGASSLILIRAEKKGLLKKVEKQFKIEEL